MISKTGPNAGGAATTQLPNYELWVKEVNALGGILLKSAGKRVPIEVIEYDDRSNSEEAVRAIERLITQDKVDFVLPPWGTGLNLAVGPTFNKHGYPHLAFTAVTDRAPELAKRWPNAFFFLSTSASYAEGLMAQLEALRKQGVIGDRIAMVSVADAFGIDLSGAARKAAGKHGFKLVYDKSYPLGTQDMTPILNEIKALNADAFVAFSYPPDTLTLTDQARVDRLQPEGVLRRRRHRVPGVQGALQGQRRGRDGHRRRRLRQHAGPRLLPPPRERRSARSPIAGRVR